MPESIKNMPDVSFIDNKTVTDVRGEMVEDYEAYVSKATGGPVKLARISRDRMILYACANAIHQGLQCTDKAGKMNFLKWSYSDFLDPWKVSPSHEKPGQCRNNDPALHGFNRQVFCNSDPARHACSGAEFHFFCDR